MLSVIIQALSTIEDGGLVSLSLIRVAVLCKYCSLRIDVGYECHGRTCVEALKEHD